MKLPRRIVPMAALDMDIVFQAFATVRYTILVSRISWNLACLIALFVP
jgi:hypothetical protein